MDGRRFDEATKALGNPASRRGVLKGAAGGALAGLVALVGAGRAGAEERVACNSDEKCEAKCGREDALCCRPRGGDQGFCIRGCGPNRVLNQRCQCVRVTDGGTFKTGPFFCGA